MKGQSRRYGTDDNRGVFADLLPGGADFPRAAEQDAGVEGYVFALKGSGRDEVIGALGKAIEGYDTAIARVEEAEKALDTHTRLVSEQAADVKISLLETYLVAAKGFGLNGVKAVPSLFAGYFARASRFVNEEIFATKRYQFFAGSRRATLAVAGLFAVIAGAGVVASNSYIQGKSSNEGKPAVAAEAVISDNVLETVQLPAVGIVSAPPKTEVIANPLKIPEPATIQSKSKSKAGGLTLEQALAAIEKQRAEEARLRELGGGSAEVGRFRLRFEKQLEAAEERKFGSKR